MGILPYFSNINKLDYQNIIPNSSVKNPLNCNQSLEIKNFKEIKTNLKTIKADRFNTNSKMNRKRI
ncbi:hypothetical protein LEP1GSC170_3591 [Leptospira interrogans serovar Bataviae str. HAI135]|nr:hypothetical protein LEP1GSC170_3591 [Leptospira interrogans serovar Bataviae str. HAI135]